jgi:hypothetical protein
MQNSTGSFGGSGSDGALSVSSGTTTIDCGNAAILIKNYKSISITGTAVIAFINPATNGTIVIFKSQGAVTITSSATQVMDLTSMGSSGGASVVNTGSGVGQGGNNGNAFGVWVGGTTATSGSGGVGGGNPGAGGGGGGASGATAGTAGGNYPSTYTGGAGGITSKINQNISQYVKIAVIPGTGGASGATMFSTSGTSGVGGTGGGAFYMECAGALNITSTFQSNGGGGGNATANKASAGGGGGAGCFVILYNTLTANSATFTTTGGTGGTSAAGAGAGGNGGAGFSYVGLNTNFP